MYNPTLYVINSNCPLLPSSVPDFGCETFVSIPEEGFSIMFIGSAYSVLPRIAWGLSWSYWVGGKGDWSTPVTFNGGAIGPVDHFILHVGNQADGYNTGFLVYAPKGKNELLFRIFHFRWPDRLTTDQTDPHGVIHYSGHLDLHNKTLVPDSVNFSRRASRLCDVEWRTTDGHSCRARINKFKKSGDIRFSGMEDLGCEAGAYEAD